MHACMYIYIYKLNINQIMIDYVHVLGRKHIKQHNYTHLFSSEFKQELIIAI